MLTAIFFLYLTQTAHQEKDGTEACQRGQIQHTEVCIASSAIIKLFSSTQVGGKVGSMLGSSSICSSDHLAQYHFHTQTHTLDHWTQFDQQCDRRVRSEH